MKTKQQDGDDIDENLRTTRAGEMKPFMTNYSSIESQNEDPSKSLSSDANTNHNSYDGYSGMKRRRKEKRSNARRFILGIRSCLLSSIIVIFLFLFTKVVQRAFTIAHANRNHDIGDKDDAKQRYIKKAQKNLDALFNNDPAMISRIPKGCRGTVLIFPHCESTLATDSGSKIVHSDACSLVGLEHAYYLITQFGNNNITSAPARTIGSMNANSTTVESEIESEKNETKDNRKKQHHTNKKHHKPKRWPIPVEIMVLGPKYKRQSAIMTATPLQRYFHNQINQRSSPTLYDHRSDLVQHIADLFRSGRMCGPNVDDANGVANNVDGNPVVLVTTANNAHDIPRLARDLGCIPLDETNACPMTFHDDDSDHAWELTFIYDDDDDGYNVTGIHGYDTSNGANVIPSTNENLETERKESELKEMHKQARWKVYGNVIDQRFDPLAFSKLVGQYGPDHIMTDDEGYPLWMNMSIYKDLGL